MEKNKKNKTIIKIKIRCSYVIVGEKKMKNKTLVFFVL